ncbi:MAG: serine hydrolase, partial [Patescibacteria group bacterium]|nr:serine hydrolase [Patescibacteria group bacterium]
ISSKPVVFKAIREKGFKYTSPLLYYEGPEENTDFVKQLTNRITSYITNTSQHGQAQNVSVYIRFPYLSDWTVINDNEKYSPASLLKVPVMMVYLNQSQFNPTLLATTLTYNIADDNQKQNFKPQEQMVQGKSYPIEDLIKRMIVYSDDTAEDLLTMNINKQDFDQIFDDIQIDRLNYVNQENSMDVKTYSYFFRVLYNATYLNRRISEQALQLLTQTTFTHGIVAGVPKNVIVAHKFGERAFADTGEKQLHDCGIVYYSQNPYILCIMTRGTSFANLETVLKNISAQVYTYTTQQSTTALNNNQN